MLSNILIIAGFVAIWLFLSPCSPWTIWKGSSCAMKRESPPSDDPKH